MANNLYNNIPQSDIQKKSSSDGTTKFFDSFYLTLTRFCLLSQTDAMKTTENQEVTRERHAEIYCDLLALAERVAMLNPDAGEIGAGMLATIVSEARAALAKAKGDGK